MVTVVEISLRFSESFVVLSMPKCFKKQNNLSSRIFVRERQLCYSGICRMLLLVVFYLCSRCDQRRIQKPLPAAVNTAACVAQTISCFVLVDGRFAPHSRANDSACSLFYVMRETYTRPEPTENA